MIVFEEEDLPELPPEYYEDENDGLDLALSLEAIEIKE
jgi:hypothetical protein